MTYRYAKSRIYELESEARNRILEAYELAEYSRLKTYAALLKPAL